MELFHKNNIEKNLPSKNSEAYQKNFECHQSNACARVKGTGLLYDAIKLAQSKASTQWAWCRNQAENHPAILKLCTFWYCFCEQDIHEARIPYIQIFLGKNEYEPLIANALIMPTELPYDVKETVKASSVIFGDEYLITFLSGREVTARQSAENYVIHYTVHNEPLFKERLFIEAGNRQTCDLQNQLALQTLNALHEFPKRFPQLWDNLKKQHEATSYEVC